MNKPLIFIDIETSGLDPDFHEIPEVAVIRIETSGQETIYHAKVHPLNIERSNSKALEINGYNSKDWREASTPAETAAQLESILAGGMLIGHNIKFDVAFISELLNNHNKLQRWDRRLIDTIVLAHEHLSYSGLESLSLDSIRTFLRWSKEGSHRALKDCQDVKRLYYRLMRANLFDRLFWCYRYKLLKWLGWIQ